MKTQTVKEWLEGLQVSDPCTNVESVAVTIHVSSKKTLTFEGARYTQRGQERFYLLGDCIKNELRRRNKSCFTFDNGEWYVATYSIKDNITPANAEFHPFGPTFLLMKWEVPDGTKIDEYEEYPYDRLAMTVKVENVMQSQ